MKPKFKLDEITVAIIVILLASVVAIYDKISKPGSTEAEKLTELILDGHGANLASGGVINESRLREIRNMDYESLKKSLNAKNDFCVLIEDENGNLILAKGSSSLSKDGINCQE